MEFSIHRFIVLHLENSATKTVAIDRVDNLLIIF